MRFFYNSKQLEIYDTILPFYYGWFINEADTNALLSMGQQWLREALTVTSFYDDFTNISGETEIEGN